MRPRDARTQRQLRPAICAVLNCRKRKDLTQRKAFIPGLLIEIDLCREHEEDADAAFHDAFRKEFGVDFVDPERN